MKEAVNAAAIAKKLRSRPAPECEECQAKTMQLVGDGTLRCTSCGHQQGPTPQVLLTTDAASAENYQQPHTGAPVRTPSVGGLPIGINALQIGPTVAHFEQPDYRAPAAVKGVADYPMYANANALQIGPTPAKRYVQPGGDPRG